MHRTAVWSVAAMASLATGAGLWAAGPAADAHTGATGVVKERMEHMKSLASAMKTIKAGVRAKPEIRRDAIAEAARAIAEHAEKTPSLFPEGSIEGPSEALPEIWQEWEAFKSANETLKAEARKLSEVAAKGDRRAVTVQFAKTARPRRPRASS